MAPHFPGAARDAAALVLLEAGNCLSPGIARFLEFEKFFPGKRLTDFHRRSSIFQYCGEGHGMGVLDCRVLLSRSGSGFR